MIIMDTSPIQATSEKNRFFVGKTQQKIAVILFVIIFLILGSSVYLYFHQKLKTNRPNIPIAKIGQETLYQKDLDIETISYPATNSADIKKLILDKLTSDSIILQAGEADKLISLDKSFFNSTDKNYSKRLDQIKKVKESFASQSAQIKGSVVSVYAFNGYLSKLGYVKSRQLALEKITALHNQVKSGKITMKQAGELIKNDTSLAQLDKNYKGNAYYEFSAVANKPVSVSPEFDKIMWSLPLHQISDIVIIKDKPYGNNVLLDSIFTFGQVTEKKEGGTQTFEQWLTEKKKQYAITTF